MQAPPASEVSRIRSRPQAQRLRGKHRDEQQLAVRMLDEGPLDFITVKARGQFPARPCPCWVRGLYAGVLRIGQNALLSDADFNRYERSTIHINSILTLLSVLIGSRPSLSDLSRYVVYARLI